MPDGQEFTPGPSSESLAGEGIGLFGRDGVLDGYLTLNGFEALDRIIEAAPAVKYLFLPVAAIMALISFIFNAIDKYNNGDKASITNKGLLAQGLLTAGLIAGTLIFYLLSAAIATFCFVGALSVMALYKLGQMCESIYNAFTCEDGKGWDHTKDALGHFFNALALTAIATALIVGGPYALLGAAILNIPALIYNIVVFVQHIGESGKRPEPSDAGDDLDQREALESPRELEHEQQLTAGLDAANDGVMGRDHPQPRRNDSGLRRTASDVSAEGKDEIAKRPLATAEGHNGVNTVSEPVVPQLRLQRRASGTASASGHFQQPQHQQLRDPSGSLQRSASGSGSPLRRRGSGSAMTR